MIYIVGKLCILALIWHRAIKIWRILLAVRILGTRPDCFVRMIWFLVICNIVEHMQSKWNKYWHVQQYAMKSRAEINWTILWISCPSVLQEMRKLSLYHPFLTTMSLYCALYRCLFCRMLAHLRGVFRSLNGWLGGRVGWGVWRKALISRWKLEALCFPFAHFQISNPNWNAFWYLSKYSH